MYRATTTHWHGFGATFMRGATGKHTSSCSSVPGRVDGSLGASRLWDSSAAPSGTLATPPLSFSLTNSLGPGRPEKLVS